MQLTLHQAATTLGKTRRQIQYLIQQERLPAHKVGGRWYVDSADLEIDPATAQRAHQRQGQLRAALDDALRPSGSSRRYSLRDLKAFQILLPVYQALCQSNDSGNHPATMHLKHGLEQLAQGCHRFGHHEKAAAYRAARDAASLAVLELVLDGTEHCQTMASTLEEDFMPAVAGLLRHSACAACTIPSSG